VSDREPMMSMAMTRREAMKALTVLVGGALIAPGVLAGGGRGGREPEDERGDQALLEDIADSLLPTTAASPGAKAAGVGATMALLLADCMATDVQQRVSDGLRAFRAICRERGGAFASLPRPERERLLREVDAAARQAGDSHWFVVVRELALRTYFTSEIGMTRAMRYVAIPGRWEGCLPLAPGQPAWGA
jgi:hypothetical protein